MTRQDPSHDGLVSAAPRSQAEAEFVREFEASYRVLWLIAVGITGNRSLADDMVQEAAVVALDKFDQFEPGSNFGAWMAQIVRNVSLNAARKEGRRRAASIGEDAVPDVAASLQRQSRGDPSPVNRRGQLDADQTQFDDSVVRALNEVGEDARACLLLKVVEGLEYAEISRILDIPEGTAMSHVHRARKLMAERLTVRRTDRPERRRHGDGAR